MVLPSLADLRRAFFGGGTNQSTTDAEYQQLLALYSRDTSLLDIANSAQIANMRPGLSRWDEQWALARKGGNDALSAILMCMGDSRVLGNASKYYKAWPFLLKNMLMGPRPGNMGILSASAGGLSQVTDGAWQGGDNPWTYTGAVTGNVLFNPGFHAANIPSAGTATITYFGDKITVFYVRTVDGPTAAAVTLDGAAQTAIDGRDPVVSPGLQVTYGTVGNYGFHTLVITPNDGPLVLEGVQWFDGDIPFLIVGSVMIYLTEHAGFGAKDWATANNDWSAFLSGGGAFAGMGIFVGDVNDINAARTPAQYKEDLKTIVSRVDTRLGNDDMSWMFVTLPVTLPDYDTTAFRDAAYEAAKDIGTHRAHVFDMAALFPNREFPAVLAADGVHMTDAGHMWVAERLYEKLDPTHSYGPTLVTPKQTIIEASMLADGRTSWTEAWTNHATGAYDQSGGGTTLGERRHRFWADPGTYRITYVGQEDTGLGTAEVLMGRYVGATPTLTSAGSKANVAGTPTVVATRLGTTIVNEIAGFVPLVIRKTTASGAIRFIKAIIDKIA